jgi:hypothetical protein
MARAQAPPPVSGAAHAQRVTKKHQIIALYLSGMTNVEDLAMLTNARPSYVGAVLQQAGFLHGYFDLYTSTAHPMNVYSKLFASKLGFKDVDVARNAVAVIDRFYTQFESTGDRAGQHHALLMALLMFNRARWTGKAREAEIFRQWLVAHLEQEHVAETAPTAATAALVPDAGGASEAPPTLVSRKHALPRGARRRRAAELEHA